MQSSKLSCWGVGSVREPPPSGRWLIRAAGSWQTAQMVVTVRAAVQLVVSWSCHLLLAKPSCGLDSGAMPDHVMTS